MKLKIMLSTALASSLVFGACTADVDMANNAISNVPDANASTPGTDAINKNYVDTINSSIAATYDNTDDTWEMNGNEVYTLGNVGIGLTNPGAKLHITGGSTIHEREASNTLNIVRTASNINSHTGYLLFEKAKGTLDTPEPLTSGATIGRIAFDAYDGSTYSAGANMRVFSDGDWNATARGSYFRFFTMKKDEVTGSDTLTLRNGNVGIGRVTNPIQKLEIDQLTNADEGETSRIGIFLDRQIETTADNIGTDRGSQYASYSHKDLLNKYGIVQSMLEW